MLTGGVWAEIEVNGEHLRLFSEHNAIGMQASVYNVKTKTWIAPSESVENIEQGKLKALLVPNRFKFSALLKFKIFRPYLRYMNELEEKLAYKKKRPHEDGTS